jgi:hypothetical protein
MRVKEVLDGAIFSVCAMKSVYYNVGVCKNTFRCGRKPTHMPYTAPVYEDVANVIALSR